ncbi:unnamed protein product [Caenorhabditis nigoni]
MVKRVPKAPKGTKNQKTLNVKETIAKFNDDVLPKLHASYEADKAENAIVRICKNKYCDCTTEDCDNYGRDIVCPKSCAKKAAGCQNQLFEQYRKQKTKCFLVKSSGKKGIGLFAARTIKKNEFIIPYHGEIISKSELQIRKEKYRANGETHTYPFKAGRFYIDPTEYGNSARFGNHSCDPNMHAKSYVVSDRKRGFKAIGFVANKNIRKGTELTIDYGYDYNPETSQRCLCRKRNCKGWIGQPPPAAIDRNDGQNRQTGSKAVTKKIALRSKLISDCRYVLNKILADLQETEKTKSGGASTTGNEGAEENLQDAVLE